MPKELEFLKEDIKIDTDQGWFKTANSLAAALFSLKVSRTERQILDFIITHSYRWKQRYVFTSIASLAETLGINKRNLPKSLKPLVNAKIIVQVTTDNGTFFAINTKYTEWDKTLTDAKKKRLFEDFIPLNIKSPKFAEAARELESKHIPRSSPNASNQERTEEGIQTDMNHTTNVIEETDVSECIPTKELETKQVAINQVSMQTETPKSIPR